MRTQHHIDFLLAKVARIFYLQGRDINRFLSSNSSVTRTHYFRILALASVDVALTLPSGILILVLNLSANLAEGGLPFYPGWSYIHDDWTPGQFSYAELRALGPVRLGSEYVTLWSSPILAFTIFGLFGLTSEACASYRRMIRAICGCFGWKVIRASGDKSPQLDAIQFNTGPEKTISLDAEVG